MRRRLIIMLLAGFISLGLMALEIKFQVSGIKYVVVFLVLLGFLNENININIRG